MTTPRLTLLVAVVLCGLSAGFFYAYEASVTVGLADVDDATYVAAFQALNDNVRNPAFGVMFFGSLPAIGVALASNWNHRHARGLIAASLVCYAALIVITGTGNVPLNDDLAGYTALTTASAREARAKFEDDWNRLNLIRTVAVMASFMLVATAAILPDRRDTRNGARAPDLA